MEAFKSQQNFKLNIIPLQPTNNIYKDPKLFTTLTTRKSNKPKATKQQHQFTKPTPTTNPTYRQRLPRPFLHLLKHLIQQPNFWLLPPNLHQLHHPIQKKVHKPLRIIVTKHWVRDHLMHHVRIAQRDNRNAPVCQPPYRRPATFRRYNNREVDLFEYGFALYGSTGVGHGAGASGPRGSEVFGELGEVEAPQSVADVAKVDVHV